MTPDDPRHGTNAGTVAHHKAGQKPCGPCRAATMRAKKARELDRLRTGEPARVPLGQEAYAIVATTNRAILSRATGVNIRQLSDYHRTGPTRVVLRTTRNKILSYRRTWTPVGIQRRLRALTLLGWSMADISDRTGVYMTSLAELRRRESLKFVRVEVAEKILAVWNELSMTPAPATHSSRETIARAARRGWVAGLAWDDIDDPNEQPTAWEYVPGTRAEQMREYDRLGRGVTAACQALKMSRDSLQKWCARNGLSHVYRSLAAREAVAENQWTHGEDAA